MRLFFCSFHQVIVYQQLNLRTSQAQWSPARFASVTEPTHWLCHRLHCDYFALIVVAVRLGVSNTPSSSAAHTNVVVLVLTECIVLEFYIAVFVVKWHCSYCFDHCGCCCFFFSEKGCCSTIKSCCSSFSIWRFLCVYAFITSFFDKFRISLVILKADS